MLKLFAWSDPIWLWGGVILAVIVIGFFIFKQ
jgi:hypothetical protein